MNNKCTKMEEFMFTSKYNDLYTPACRIALSAGDAWFFLNLLLYCFIFFYTPACRAALSAGDACRELAAVPEPCGEPCRCDVGVPPRGGVTCVRVSCAISTCYILSICELVIYCLSIYLYIRANICGHVHVHVHVHL